MLNYVTDIKKQTSEVASHKSKRWAGKYTELVVHRKAKSLPSELETTWKNKRTRTPGGDSGAIAICRSCCEKGNTFSVIHRRAIGEWCGSSSAHSRS